MSRRSESGYDPVGDPRTGRPPLPDERERSRQPDEIDSGDQTKSAVGRVASGSIEAAQTLRSAGEAVTEQVSAATTAAMERGSALAISASEQVQTYAGELVAFVRRRPLGALAGAVILGLLVGLVRRRRSD
jgi:hypothetical protein